MMGGDWGLLVPPTGGPSKRIDWSLSIEDSCLLCCRTGAMQKECPACREQALQSGLLVLWHKSYHV